jgi:hypothetical protein
MVLEPITPEAVQQAWDSINDFSPGKTNYPTSNPELMGIIMTELTDHRDAVNAVKPQTNSGMSETVHFSYSSKDVILYALAGNLIKS